MRGRKAGESLDVDGIQYGRGMADTKQTKTIGEHYAAAELARRGWAPAFTRDGLARTDILAVMTEGVDRRLVEIQVKATRHVVGGRISWMLGEKAQMPSLHDREFFVLVAVPLQADVPPRFFVVPRTHLAAAAWIQHMAWLTDPSIPAGARNASVNQARVSVDVFTAYESRWDFLMLDDPDVPVLLPRHMRGWALEDRVGLPPGHPWAEHLPDW
ncbi:hypothetical protein ACFVAJ_19120 [Agromyces sp. NPDC057679]|uniref:hypothetical protein n=1 Tax=Agromyces sp. NPDC057679 TaxID=3346207 RepID=UPI003670166A